jgi:DNA-directed RNA polymerase subunit RPC12/RpoP
MTHALGDRKAHLFPCSVCGEGLEVRETKKGKPYVICNPCGMQMFVRVESGIRRFEKLVADAGEKDIWERLEELQERYHKKCPRCGQKFWVTPDLIKTSWLDGDFEGYRCFDSECDGIVKVERAK